MEDRFRRNNIQVHEVTEEKGETFENCEREVLDKLKDKLAMEDVTKKRYYRENTSQNNKNNKGKAPSWTMIFKILNCKDKTFALRKFNRLKGISYCTC